MTTFVVLYEFLNRRTHMYLGRVSHEQAKAAVVNHVLQNHGCEPRIMGVYTSDEFTAIKKEQEFQRRARIQDPLYGYINIEDYF